MWEAFLFAGVGDGFRLTFKSFVNEDKTMDINHQPTEKTMNLPAKTRKRLNSAICSICNRLHDSIPTDQIFGALRREGFVLLQEDGTPWQGMLLGRESRATLPLGKLPEDGPAQYPFPVQNSVLVLSWYRYDTTGRFDCNAYVS